ncbi:MAG: ParB/RepB/Spo0J family partition protein [Planctomycetota bacterium]|jgi:ParB family chromosome partitioning protein
MATSQIPFDSIEFSDEITNPRDELKDIDDLMSSIKAVGLQVPLTVLHEVTSVDGEKKERYCLIVGFRRHEAISRIRKQDPNAFRTVEVKKFKGSAAEAQVLNITENIQRSELTPIEICRGVEILLNLGYKQKEIADKIGKSQTWVSNAMQFKRRATPQLQEAVREGKVSYGFARDIATLPDKEQRQRVKQIQSSGDGKKDKAKEVETGVRKEVRESSGRIIRPSTAEIRYEVQRLFTDSNGDGLDDFDGGVLAALEWALGEKKTLRRPDGE